MQGSVCIEGEDQGVGNIASLIWAAVSDHRAANLLIIFSCFPSSESRLINFQWVKLCLKSIRICSGSKLCSIAMRCIALQLNRSPGPTLLKPWSFWWIWDQTRPDQTILPIWLIQSITFCCSPQSLCSNHSMWPVSTIMVPMSRWYTSVFDGLVIFRMQTVQGCPSDGRFYWAMHQQPQVNLATCAKSVAPVNFPIDFQPVFALAWAIPGPGLWQCWWQEMGEDEG